jgi:uncharacterized protein (TIGR03437 family)
MLAAGFGEDLATAPASATQLPLPHALAGMEIEVNDSAGSNFSAELLFVSKKQINYLVPAGAATGLARVRVRRDGDLVAAGMINISSVAPAVFALNAEGTGLAAASWLQISANGTPAEGLVFEPQTLKAVAVSHDPAQGQTYLILYGTGVRGFVQAVTATVGGIPVSVSGAGPQGQFSGLDQINIGPLPAGLAGGEHEIVLAVDGIKTNPVTVLLK